MEVQPSLVISSKQIENLGGTTENGTLEADYAKLVQENALSDDAFIKVWGKLGKLALDIAAFTDNARTPLDTFLSTGLLRFAAKKDIAFQQKLYEALPSAARYYELYAEDSELMAEFVIPNPEVTDWSLNR
ncbi:hypothetical protein FACS189449_10320 [Alphaproteobacteria bacterium]|nr:hypothetical protein FACS189449_10320 [Alphaproteobacteria bacterium]